jgi:hypothetical protein
VEQEEAAPGIGQPLLEGVVNRFHLVDLRGTAVSTPSTDA